MLTLAPSHNPPTQQPRKPVTVLHARVVTGAGGGPDKTILRSPRYLREHGYDELCAYLRPPGDVQFASLERRAKEADAELIAIDDRGPFDRQVIRDLLQLCRDRQVDIWHGHDYKSNALGILLQRYWPMRLLTTVHGWVQHTWRTPLYYLIDRWSLRWYERVVCVSTDLHTACLRAGVAKERCLLLDNAIELDVYTRRQTTAQAKAALGLHSHRKLVGAVGRLSAEKGFDLLIKAIAQLIAQGEAIDLVILGEGPQRGELEQLIRALNVSEHVRLLGHRNDVPLWLEAMDLFVLSSLREGLPNVVLESMALETPVLATNVGGMARLIEHDHNGWLIPSHQQAALQDSIRNLLHDTTLGQRLATAGRATIQARFDFAARMAKMRTIYDDLLSQPAP